MLVICPLEVRSTIEGQDVRESAQPARSRPRRARRRRDGLNRPNPRAKSRSARRRARRWLRMLVAAFSWLGARRVRSCRRLATRRARAPRRRRSRWPSTRREAGGRGRVLRCVRTARARAFAMCACGGLPAGWGSAVGGCGAASARSRAPMRRIAATPSRFDRPLRRRDGRCADFAPLPRIFGRITSVAKYPLR